MYARKESNSSTYEHTSANSPCAFILASTCHAVPQSFAGFLTTVIDATTPCLARLWLRGLVELRRNNRSPLQSLAYPLLQMIADRIALEVRNG